MNTQWDTTRRYITQYDAVKKQVKLEGKLANFWYDNMYKIATSASKIPGMEDLKPASQAPADVMRSIPMHMLLGVRNSKSGEGAPGNLAVQEWGFLGDSVPNLSQSSEGRDLIMEMYRTSADFVNEKYRTMERLTNEKVAKNPSSVSEARMELGEKLDNKMMEQGFLYRVDADKILADFSQGHVLRVVRNPWSGAVELAEVVESVHHLPRRTASR